MFGTLRWVRKVIYFGFLERSQWWPRHEVRIRATLRQPKISISILAPCAKHGTKHEFLAIGEHFEGYGSDKWVAIIDRLY